MVSEHCLDRAGVEQTTLCGVCRDRHLACMVGHVAAKPGRKRNLGAAVRLAERLGWKRVRSVSLSRPFITIGASGDPSDLSVAYLRFIAHAFDTALALFA